MSDKDLPSAKPRDKIAPSDQQQLIKQREQVLGHLVKKLKPWLLEFGTWIFGGLIAVNLIVVSALLTVGPDHPAILISVAAFACALPLNVTGLFLLRLIKDMSDLEIDDVMRQAFEDANVPDVDTHFPASEDKEALYKRRADVGLRYSVRLAALNVTLTVLGLLAALWYMAWWVAVIFFVTVILSLAIAITVIPNLMRPASEAEKKPNPRNQKQRRQRNSKPGSTK